jgi:hypothetical protein
VNEITDGIALVYQGLYDSTRTYLRNTNIAEVVFVESEDTYYVVKTGINTVPTNNTPPDTSLWTEVPTFKILATDLLLAQDVTVRRSLTLGDADLESEYGGKGIIKSLGGYDSSGNYTIVQNDIDDYGFYVDTSGSFNLGSNLFWNPLTKKLNVIGDINATNIISESGSIANWIINDGAIYKESGNSKIELNSSTNSLSLYDDDFKRVNIGITSSLDPSSYTNLAYLTGSEWTVSEEFNSAFAEYEFGTPSYLGVVGNAVSITHNQPPATVTTEVFEIKKNIGDIVADTNIVSKFSAFSYVDAEMTNTLAINVYESASTNPIKIDELSGEKDFNNTGTVTKSSKKYFISSYTENGYNDVELRLRLEAKFLGNSTSIYIFEIGDLETIVSVPQVIINSNSTLFYNNALSYLKWDRDKLLMRGGEMEVNDLIVGGATFEGDVNFLGNVTVSGSLSSHPDISNVPSNIDNSNGTVIQDINFDTYGHVVGIGSKNLNNIYYTETESDNRFFNVAGDTVTGNAIFSGSSTFEGSTKFVSDVHFDESVVVSGSMTILGDTFSASVQTVEIEDNLLVINKGETGAGITAGLGGIQIDRGTSDPFWFISDENRGGKFAVGTSGSTQLVATRGDSPTDHGIPY